jgi:hypothetical protein
LLDGSNARIFGQIFAVRARHGQTRGQASLCVRAENLVPDPAGFAATVANAAYIGGAWEIEAAPDAAPDLRLRALLDDGAHPKAGDKILLGLKDGWVLPD